MERPNVLVIVLDSVRADRLSCYGYERPTTPHLDAIAAEGVRFEAAYSESSWTAPAAFTLLTGLAPREHGAESLRALPASLPVLPEALRSCGYQTLGVSANKLFGPYWGLHRGFDRFFTALHVLRITRPVVKYLGQRLGWTDRGGRAVTARFLRALREARPPWLAWLWYNDAHHPYLAPRPFTARFCRGPLSLGRQMSLFGRMRRMPELAATAREDELATVGDLYDGCVAYEDSLVGEVRAELERRGLWEETVVAVAADHGEMLGERRLLGHGAPADLYRPLVRVPLIVRAPGRLRAGGSTQALVQLADLTRSLASLADAGDRLAPTAAPTVDLFAAAEGSGRPYAIAEREPMTDRRLQAARRKNPHADLERHRGHVTAVVEGDWRLIDRTDGRSELYNLRDDPREERDLFAAEPLRAVRLAEIVRDWHTRARPRTEAAPPEAEEVVERRLRELGYL